MKKTNKKVIAGWWWVFLTTILCLGLGIALGFGYQAMIWHFLDALFQNLVFVLRSDQLTMLAEIVTNFGYYGSIMIWLLIVACLIVKRQWRVLGLSLFLAGGGYGFGYGLKAWISRPRPENPLILEAFHSYPSLHMLTATVLYLTLAYLSYHYSRRFWWSYLVFVIGLIIMLMVGFSRIYLGVHYFSDVLGGLILGIGWVNLALFIEKGICLIAKKTHRSTKI